MHCLRSYFLSHHLAFYTFSTVSILKSEHEFCFNYSFHAELDSGLIEVISPRGSYYPDLNAVRETFGDTQERVK